MAKNCESLPGWDSFHDQEIAHIQIPVAVGETVGERLAFMPSWHQVPQRHLAGHCGRNNERNDEPLVGCSVLGSVVLKAKDRKPKPFPDRGIFQMSGKFVH